MVTAKSADQASVKSALNEAELGRCDSPTERSLVDRRASQVMARVEVILDEEARRISVARRGETKDLIRDVIHSITSMCAPPKKVSSASVGTVTNPQREPRKPKENPCGRNPVGQDGRCQTDRR